MRPQKQTRAAKRLPASPARAAASRARIVQYSDHAIAVIGNTFPLRAGLRDLGGAWNKHLRVDGEPAQGWVFEASLQSTVEAFLAGRASVALPAREHDLVAVAAAGATVSAATDVEARPNDDANVASVDASAPGAAFDGNASAAQLEAPGVNVSVVVAVKAGDAGILAPAPSVVASPARAAAPRAKVRVVQYSDRAIAVIGDTFALRAGLRGLGGAWNKYLRVDGEPAQGWIFKAALRPTVEAYLAGHAA